MTLEERRLDELRKLRGNRPAVTREELVAFAEDQATAWHSAFEWDNDKAGHAYRLEQAGKLLRVFVRILDDGTGKAREFRAFAAIVDQAGYQETEIVISDADKRRDLLAASLQRIDGILKSYPLPELAPVQRAVDRVRSSLGIDSEAA